jgi:hypothetical protein
MATHDEVMHDKVERRKSQQADNDIARDFRELMQKLKARAIPINVRVKNGSYKVTNYISEDIHPGFSKHANENDDNNESGHLAKQNIQTVQNQNPCYKIAQLLLKCVVNKGNVRGRKEEKYLMEGVDLALESGKMYLVL